MPIIDADASTGRRLSAMPFSPGIDPPSMPDHPSPTADASERLQAVEAAISTLRRGLPVVLGGGMPLVLLAVEVADNAGLEAFNRIAAAAPVLLLSSTRAVTLGIVAESSVVSLDPSGLGLDALSALADPTRPALADCPVSAAVPMDAVTALRLAVAARLLPALLAASAPNRVGVSPADIADYAALSAAALVRVSEAAVPLEDAADARLVAFRSPGSGLDQYAVLIGRPEEQPAPLVRVHSECFTGDLLGSLRCDCGAQLRSAIRRMAAEGAGALLYLAQEGRGIGLPSKLRAYVLQDRGLDTLDANRTLGFAADERDFRTAASMLRHLGLRRIRLLTNNPDKIAALSAYGIEVVARASLLIAANGVDDHYLETKRTRFGHLPE